MNIQPNPCRVASQTTTRVPVRATVKLPRLWFNLPAETQRQIAQSLAALLLRKQATEASVEASRHAEQIE